MADDNYINQKLKTAGCMIGLIVFVAVVVGVYEDASDKGWIPHSSKALVAFPVQNWELGQYVLCTAQTWNNSANGAHGIVLNCTGESLGASPPREMDVKFWGVVSEKEWTNFSCQRLQDSIVCRLPEK
jgi:hypothetical protein